MDEYIQPITAAQMIEALRAVPPDSTIYANDSYGQGWCVYGIEYDAATSRVLLNPS
jgi:hypothetical protein